MKESTVVVPGAPRFIGSHVVRLVGTQPTGQCPQRGAVWTVSTAERRSSWSAGATMEEIMEVLKLCVVQGVQACNLGVPILAEEIANRSAKGHRPKKRTGR